MGVYSYATRTGGRFAPLAGVGALQPEDPAVFPQTPGSLDWLLGPALQELPQSEDAFQVSVFAPEDADSLPVMVFLPGGGFVSGAGTVRWYDAQDFAEQQNCVVVLVNYRIGLLAHDQQVGGGNLPVEELLLALEWVQRNISGLGGDPQETTLAGQSAGAFWAFALAQLDRARGLFKRVYLGSLSYQPPMSQTMAEERNAVVAEALGGKSMAEASTAELVAAGAAVSGHWAGRGLGLYPTADQAVPADLFDARAAARRLHVDEVLLSHTADEAGAFIGMAPEQAFTTDSVRGFIAGNFADPDQVYASLVADAPQSSAKQLLIRAMTLHQIQLFASEFADAAADAGTRVQLLGFEVRSPLPGAGCAHCFDLPFLLNNRSAWHDAPMLQGLAEPAFAAAATLFSGALGSFIRTGTAHHAEADPLAVHAPGAETMPTVSESGLAARPIDRRFGAKRHVLA